MYTESDIYPRCLDLCLIIELDLLSWHIIELEADSSSDTTDDGGHAPGQQVEPQHWFSGEGHRQVNRRGWGLLGLHKLLQHVTEIQRIIEAIK